MKMEDRVRSDTILRCRMSGRSAIPGKDPVRQLLLKNSKRHLEKIIQNDGAGILPATLLAGDQDASYDLYFKNIGLKIGA